MPAVVLNHHLLNGNCSMTLITFQDGVAVMRDGKVGTEQACCCEDGCAPCPDLESLCISITLTDYNGNVYTANEADVSWFAGTGTVYFNGFDYAVTIACDLEAVGGISVSAGWASLIDDCICTSGFGNDGLACSNAEKWYLGTAAATIQFDDIGLPCGGGCPADLGTFSVTFADPPC